MIKCDECGDDTHRYYEDNGNKLCFICYHKKHTFKDDNKKNTKKNKDAKVKEMKKKEGKKSEKEEKWIVLKNGNEEVWTQEKVDQTIKTATTYKKIAGLIGLVFLILFYWIYFTSNADFTTHAINNLWIIIILISVFILGFYGEKMTKNAKHAKEIYKVKK